MDKQAGQDLAALKFEKEALETKLRKYLSYCKALESDKAQIIDALRSRRRNVVDDDFAGAVVSLCDQLISLEEECDALSNAEGRVSSYLVEIEKLRERVASQESDVERAKTKITELARSETDMKAKLTKAEEKNASLREDREKLRNLPAKQQDEPKKSRQVKYLEQENLQLMLDLKTTKKQLQNTRSELDNVRMKAWDQEDTDDLTNYAGPVETARSGSSIFSKSTEGSKQSPPMADKENKVVQHNAKATTESTTKRKLARGKLSGSRTRESNRRSVGLGEAGDDEENTGECRQS